LDAFECTPAVTILLAMFYGLQISFLAFNHLTGTRQTSRRSLNKDKTVTPGRLVDFQHCEVYNMKYKLKQEV